MSYIQSIQLHNVRCYDAMKMEGINKGLVILCGANGAGKTNILEAASLLTPGRGLRGAALEDIQKQNSTEPWAIFASIDTGGAQVRIGTGGDGPRRNVRINGVTSKSQIALADYLSCVWLTPQMDRLFTDSASGRRRFFDKLIFAFDPAHAGRVTRYENAMAQRSRLLRDGGEDSWISGLEIQMASTGTAIAAARVDFLLRLQHSCDLAGSGEESFFPRSMLSLAGTVEDILMHSPALEAEEKFLERLYHSRVRDAENGGALAGPHKSDLMVKYAAKNMPAAQCSTGEQKALLIGIILAHGRLLAAEKGAPPVLLMDEIAAHLDEGRRRALYDLLSDLRAQVWMTGTDESLFAAALGRGQFWSVDHARVTCAENPSG